jgi:hypothetical protein
LQFACDQGKSFWGHFIVDNACLRAELKPDHPDLKQARLASFAARVRAAPSRSNPEVFELTLETTPDARRQIASVEYEGYYRGYDENGNGKLTDWHGFTKNRLTMAHLGTTVRSPFTVSWDMTMLPAQDDMRVRARVRFRHSRQLVYITPATGGLATPGRAGSRVQLCSAEDIPAPFLSRVGRRKSCKIHLDVEPARIERAELHVVVWDGGAGTIKDYFTLNGHPLPVAGDGKHDVLYSQVKLDPAWLKAGANRIELMSDTEHHGLEILMPGPALVVRSQ